jgi:signal transduction histidine kinase
MLTMLCTIALGAFSLFYLQQVLASSRETTLARRVGRLERFIDSASQIQPNLSLKDALQEFSVINPENDVFRVEDASMHPLISIGWMDQNAPWPNQGCDMPCFRLIKVHGSRMRLLQQNVTLRGQRMRLTLAGQVDEHYDILRMVRNSYLISVPILWTLSIAAGLLLAHRALMPVDRITRAAQTISIRDMKSRLPVPQTGDEIERLAVAWNDLLERLDVAVSRLRQFTGDISHDLRTSLTVMSATTQVSLKKRRTTEEYEQALGIILLECQSTTQLLDDLLAASRTETQEQLAHIPIPISEIMEEACEQIRGRVEEKQLVIRSRIESDHWISGDLSLIRRLILILLDNAVKYTPRSGAITVLLQEEGKGLELHVEDTGVGIAADQLDRVFDRFYRVDSSRNRDHSGNGLGLAIAKWITEVHGATISVSSNEHKGSTFTVHFSAL